MAGCASTPGAKPQDMSAENHEAAATRESKIASTQASAYDPNATKTVMRCSPNQETGSPCWTAETNPTAEHLKAAERHQKMAADHHAAAKVLLDAEAQSCKGLAVTDRDVSPFEHREDVEGMDLLEEKVASARSGQTVQAGAVVYFRPVPGLTKELFQAIINCHLARNAALGYEVPEMAYCPLAVKGVTAEVRSDGARFAVAIRSSDTDARKEVIRRARALVASPGPN